MVVADLLLLVASLRCDGSLEMWRALYRAGRATEDEMIREFWCLLLGRADVVCVCLAAVMYTKAREGCWLLLVFVAFRVRRTSETSAKSARLWQRLYTDCTLFDNDILLPQPVRLQQLRHTPFSPCCNSKMYNRHIYRLQMLSYTLQRSAVSGKTSTGRRRVQYISSPVLFIPVRATSVDQQRSARSRANGFPARLSEERKLYVPRLESARNYTIGDQLDKVKSCRGSTQRFFGQASREMGLSDLGSLQRSAACPFTEAYPGKLIGHDPARVRACGQRAQSF